MVHSLYVSDVIKICDGVLVNGDGDREIGHICTDSRKIMKGDTFVCLVGSAVDGNDYVREAIDKGASVCIVNRVDVDFYGDGVVVLVKDSVDCLQRLASYKRDMYDIPVIAVTGSVGKTSTKDIIYSVVSQKYKTCRTIGNYNNHLGLPLTILSIDDGDEALVVEMGMNHLGEISLLSKIAKPTIGVITNIGTAHIGNLGSRENILRAKSEILDGMVGDKVIINMDDDMLRGFYDRYKDSYELYGYSIDSESDYKAVNIIGGVFDSKFDIRNRCFDICVNVGGSAYVYNALVAYIVGDILGISDDDIKRGIGEFKLSSGRLERCVNKRGVVVINDAYNANYDSMCSSINLLGSVRDKRKVLILGDMLELGEYAYDLHWKVGSVVVSNDIDVLVVIGKYASVIADGAISLGYDCDKVFRFDDVSDIGDDFYENFSSLDVILVKASHGMNLGVVVDKLMGEG